MADEALAREESNGEMEAMIQRCPNETCKTLMKKVSGCNAAICPVCQTYICIFCCHVLTATNYGNDFAAHGCRKQQRLDENTARRVAQRKALAEGGESCIMVEASGNQMVKIPLVENETVSTLQAKIAEKTDIVVEKQQLSYAGKPITPQTVLSHLKLQNGACLTLTVNASAGK
jgi:hypothetical protein